MSASAAPAPDRAALLDCALACPVCSESFRRTHSLCCAQFTSGPFHREAHRSLGGGARKASTTARGANARTAGAPASASITASGAGATTSGAPSASTTARGVNARTAGAPASASITARGDDDVFCQLRNYAAAEVVWRRGGAPFGGAASGHGLHDAAPAVRDPVLQHWPGLRARLDVGSR